MSAVRTLRRRLVGESGYSLTELLIVLVIMGVVMGGITTVFVSGSKAELDMNQRFQAQQNARASISRLRADIHVACSTPSGTAQASLLLYPAATSGCAATPTVAWCVTASTAMTNRFALYRVAGSACTTATNGQLMADYLTTNALFTATVPASGSLLRENVTVTLPVQVNSSSSQSIGKYTLIDTIVLRNFAPA